MAIYQGFVKLLDGTTSTLIFSSPTISIETLKHHLFDLTQIPPIHQRLVSGTHSLTQNETLISASADGFFPTIHLLLRLRGGKGGFGSLLRGAATKAGQKKTNNFDACRDMSGRRLRHVNAERRLEEWKAEEEERRLERVAEEFIKKKAKEARKKGGSGGGGDGGAERYVEKYREESSKCMEEVEASVKEAFLLYESSKRKIMPASGSKSKRLKMLMIEEEKGDDDSDGDSDEDEEKSVVLDENKDGEGCSTSMSGGHSSDGESSGGGSAGSNLDMENNGATQPDAGLESEEAFGNGMVDEKLAISSEVNLDDGPVSGGKEASETEMGSSEEVGHVNESRPESGVGDEVTGCASASGVIENNVSNSTAKNAVEEDKSDKSLSFDEFNTASEMEVLGMERLKAELQAHGLKCGGTLQERAARLFLLKTTPVEKLPKKLLAKK